MPEGLQQIKKANKGTKYARKWSNFRRLTSLQERETSDTTGEAWDTSVAKATRWCHLLQSDGWATVKAKTAWRARQVIIDSGKDSLPVVLYGRSVPGLGTLHYVPKLANLDSSAVQRFTTSLKSTVRSSIAIRLELDQPYDEILHDELLRQGWIKSTSIQYAHTVLVDVSRSPAEMLAGFKKRARWEISASSRRGVVVERVDCTPDKLKLFFNMLRITSRRANFKTRNQKFSERYWKLYCERGQGAFYLSRHEHDVLAMAFIIKIGDRAYYKDGASLRHKSNLFGSRALHWQIMQDLHNEGYSVYDMCGVPGPLNDDPGYKGVHTFKTGFAEPVELQGSYVLPIGRRKYEAWSRLEPLMLKAYLTLYNDMWY